MVSAAMAVMGMSRGVTWYRSARVLRKIESS
jgi:hypothetical protein